MGRWWRRRKPSFPPARERPPGKRYFPKARGVESLPGQIAHQVLGSPMMKRKESHPFMASSLLVETRTLCACLSRHIKEVVIRRQALDVKWKRDTHLPPSEKPALSNPRQHSVLPPSVPPCLLAAGTIRVPSPRFSRQMNPWRTKKSRATEAGVCQRSFEARQAKKNPGTFK